MYESNPSYLLLQVVMIGWSSAVTISGFVLGSWGRTRDNSLGPRAMKRFGGGGGWVQLITNRGRNEQRSRVLSSEIGHTHKNFLVR